MQKDEPTNENGAVVPSTALFGVWMPIETAPKDGTSILLAKAIDADGRQIKWEDDIKTAQVFVQVAAWWRGNDAWIVYCSMIEDPHLHFTPTHWMPLPSSPNPTGERTAHMNEE